MDRLVYVAMSGASETLLAQAANSHNLANASTVGFRADLNAFRSLAVDGSGFGTRVYASDQNIGFDAQNGQLQTTGHTLDVAVNGDGWLAVLAGDGREAYTRAGDLRVETDGRLRNGSGREVLGEAGPITVPPHATVSVGSDGSVSIVPLGQDATTVATVGRIKLVKPMLADLQRGADGLFRRRDGADAPHDPSVQLISGAIEASNVNVAEAMTQMIELARRFELQVKAIRAAEENAAASSRLLQSPA